MIVLAGKQRQMNVSDVKNNNNHSDCRSNNNIIKIVVRLTVKFN